MAENDKWYGPGNEKGNELTMSDTSLKHNRNSYQGAHGPENNALPQSEKAYDFPPEVLGGNNVASQGQASHSSTSQGQGGHMSTPQGQRSHSSTSQGQGGHMSTPQGQRSHSSTSQGQGGHMSTSQGQRSHSSTSQGQGGQMHTPQGQGNQNFTPQSKISDQTVIKSIWLHVRADIAEIIEQLGFSEHLKNFVPNAMVEFQTEHEMVQIKLTDPTSTDFQEVLKDFIRSIIHEEVSHPDLHIASFSEEDRELLLKKITETVNSNCYFQVDETSNSKIRIFGLSKDDVANATGAIYDVLTKFLPSQSVSPSPSSRKVDVTLIMTNQLLVEFINKFRDDFNVFCMRHSAGKVIDVKDRNIRFSGISAEEAQKLCETFVNEGMHTMRFAKNINFLIWDRPRQYVDCQLEKNGLKCCWGVFHDDMHVEVLACTKDLAQKASMLIDKCVHYQFVSINDDQERNFIRELLHSEFRDAVLCEDINNSSLSRYVIGTTEDILNLFYQKLKERYKKFSQMKTYVEMAAEEAEHFKQRLQDDVAKIEQMYGVKITFNQHGIEVTGNVEKNLQNATQHLRSLESTLVKSNIISSTQKSKALFSDKAYLSQQQKKHKFCTLHHKSGCVLVEPRQPLEKYCWYFGQQRLIQAEGKISEASADILLCPMDDLFQPVGVGKEIIKKAGSSLSTYIWNFSKTEANLKEGYVHFYQNTGQLKCHCIAFAVFPSPPKCTEKVVKKIYESILQYAIKQGYHTLAMPVTTVEGKSKVFLRGIMQANKNLKSNFVASMSNPSSADISEILLVTTTPEETEYLNKKLHMETKSEACIDWSHVFPLSEEEKTRKSGIRIEVMDNSIVAKDVIEKTDMIVNSVDKGLEFNAGIVSVKLLNHLGNSVKEECRNQKPKGIYHGEVVTSGAGPHYKNKKVCHASIPPWVLLNNFSIKVLKCIVLKCLKKADDNGLRSVSFPALGTGTLKYPHKKVAETMVGCVYHYGKKNTNTKIEVVNFVIYQASEVIQAFLDAQIRMQELPNHLTLEGVPKGVLPYLEYAKSNSSCLLRIAPKYPFEKIPLDFVVTLDTESQHPSEKGQVSWDKILNRFEMCASILKEDLSEVVCHCLNECIHHGASSVAFVFKTATVQKQHIDTIAATFLGHKTNGQITACYILLEDMEVGIDSSKAQTAASVWESFLEATGFSSRIHWLQKEACMSDFFQEVHCLTVVSHGADLKSLTAEVEADLQKTPVTQRLAVASDLDEGFKHQDKRSLVTSNKTSYVFPMNAANPDGKLHIAAKVDQDFQDKNQPKRRPSLNDVFDDVSAEVNPGLRKHLQTVKDKMKHIKFSDSQNEHHPVSGKMGDVFRLDEVLRSSLNRSRGATGGQPTDSRRSDSESSLGEVVIVPMTYLEYLAVEFYMQDNSQWKTIMPQWGADSLSFMTDQIPVKEAKELEGKITEKLATLKSVSWGEIAVQDQFKGKVEDGIKEMQQTADLKHVFCHFNEDTRIIHVFSQKYDDITKAKHKIQVVIGAIKVSNRRDRRFDAGRSDQLQHTRTSPRDHSNVSSPYFPPVDSSSFHTKEGLVVKVYSASILHLDVDCIVNAANGDLQHGGGVARVISDAAGYEFGKESRDYIYRHGPLRVGEVCTTTAGNLKYKGVIHAVGPRWHDYGQDQQLECLGDLKAAVKNSLEEADFQGYKSIAIPAISSGIFGVPKELCTQEYYRAVEEYSCTRRSHSTLTEVHFIDKDTQMCQLIQMTFTKCFTGDHGAGSGDRNTFSSSVRSPRRTEPYIKRSNSLQESSVDPPRNLQKSTSSGQSFEIANNLTVHIIHGNIVDIKADAIVSPENIQCDGTGRIAREIIRVAGEDYVEKDLSQLIFSLKKPKLTEVVDTLAGRSQFKYVLHVVAPEWDAAATADQYTYWKNLEKSYDNVLSLVDRKHLDVTSIALPILGTGMDPKHHASVTSISKMIVRVCKDYAEKTPSKKTLYFCNDEAENIKKLADVFEEHFKNKPESDQRSQEEIHPGQADLGVTGHDQGSKVTEDCCICMDTITDPKRLSCGHVFCRDCIDQQFQYKPACPQCGAVYGKITGDQPPGTIAIKTTKPSYGRHGSLPGYPRYGIISITYNFPSGRQGPEHPTPGKYYGGISRTAYLPDNDKGRVVSKLLNIAFNRKLVFTIGRSRTTGYDGVVTWNDIHHKTRIDGGPQAFGYPDDTYLDRVLDELKAKGVTEESLKDP